MKRNTILFLTICLLISQTIFSQKVNKTIEDRKKAFMQVWSTVNEKHFDPTFGGVDWLKIRKIYEPKVLLAKNDEEFHDILQQMLGELKLSHFSIISIISRNTDEFFEGKSGFEIKIVENQPVVSKISIDSQAEKNGIKKGFILNAIDGKNVSEILKPLEASFAKSHLSEQIKKVYRERFLMNLVDGKADTKVIYAFLNSENKTVDIALTRQKHTAEYSQPLGNFPGQEIIFESKILENNIGYIHFNMWLIPQMPKIRQAISEMKNTKGIIFDLRGNPGGVGGLASGVAGLICSEQTSLGTMKSRDSEQKFIVYPQKEVFTGKIMVLTDYGSASTSEVFAAGLQEIGRAKIVGETSSGAVLPSVFVYLPTGAIFQYAVSDYKSPKKILIENRGVIPDFEVIQTRKSLLENKDLPLETAMQQILKGN